MEKREERFNERMFVRKAEHKQDNRTFNGDNSEEVKQFKREIRRAEIERKKSNEQSISNLENDLYKYDEMLVMEMKTKQQATELRELILTRINALIEFNDIVDDAGLSERYNKAIDRAKRYVKRIDYLFDSLPTEVTKIPAELDTPKAKEMFKRAIEKGFINTDLSFNGTKYQMAYFAERAFEYLNLKYKWKPFITLWDYKLFPQTRYESKERIGYVDKQNEIDSIFI